MQFCELITLPLHNINCLDHPSWKNSVEGNLCLAKAWKSIRSRGILYAWHKIVWHNLMQPATAFFAWRFCHSSTPTSVWLKRLDVHLPFACPLCLRDEETDLHLFFLCQASSRPWRWLLDIAENPSSHSAVWNSLTFNSRAKESRIMGILMCSMIHAIWKTRNRVLFFAGSPSTSTICDCFNEEESFILRRLSFTVYSSSLKKIMNFFIAYQPL